MEPGVGLSFVNIYVYEKPSMREGKESFVVHCGDFDLAAMEYISIVPEATKSCGAHCPAHQGMNSCQDLQCTLARSQTRTVLISIVSDTYILGSSGCCSSSFI